MGEWDYHVKQSGQCSSGSPVNFVRRRFLQETQKKKTQYHITLQSYKTKTEPREHWKYRIGTNPGKNTGNQTRRGETE
jgi:hypothetical protein